ncbi:TRAP transporter small permease subunit [Halomonas sp. MCCC 1A11057]|uniref:TRAP transporter small permease n=1 Tax=Halomonas sp. MCCC 1A11057 TaxID=2733482 RepID=UPI001F42FA75|nr:TRAP transporter small permease subunit [Halomonas sp. MCCC 1A11057]MCE8032101.1 TRAP transporter small permease subunit [Halomonas sp. MCCC 1A11057]
MSALFRPLILLVSRLLAIGAGLCMATIFLIVFCNAVLRYALGSSLAWGDQLPVFLGIYGVMFGLSLGYLQDRHVRLGLLVDFLPERFREILFLIVDLSVVVIGVLLSWSGYLFMQQRGGMRVSGLHGAMRDLSQLTGLDLSLFATMAPYQFALCLGGTMLALAAVLKFIERLALLHNTQSSVPEGV